MRRMAEHELVQFDEWQCSATDPNRNLANCEIGTEPPLMGIPEKNLSKDAPTMAKE